MPRLPCPTLALLASLGAAACAPLTPSAQPPSAQPPAATLVPPAADPGNEPPAAPAALAAAVEAAPPSTTVAPEASAPAASAPAAVVPVAAAQAATPARLQIEPSYHAGGYPYPASAPERKAALVDLDRWNQGGLGADEKWHPVPRVVIEEPVAPKGKGDTKSWMRHLRAEHYGTVRRCYDAALREQPELGGRVVIRASLRGDGVISKASAQGGKGVPDKRKHRTALGSAAVGRCIAAGLQGARLPAPRKGSATIAFSVDVYPGDAPLPEPEGSSPGRLDLAEVDRAVQAQSAAVGACFEAASKQKPGIWGRLALGLDVAADGRVRDGREVGSTFPSAEATRCALDALRSLRLPPPRGGEARLVVAFRWKPADALATTPSWAWALRRGRGRPSRLADHDHGYVWPTTTTTTKGRPRPWR